MCIHLRTRHYSIRTEEAYISIGRSALSFFTAIATREIWGLPRSRLFEPFGRWAPFFCLYTKPSQGCNAVFVQAGV
jgi:hypothetical protein